MQRTYSKRIDNKLVRKENLYVAAVTLFRQRGFDETRVEEITRAAGVSKGTFFNYFPTKEDVLLYIGERHMSRLSGSMNNGAGKQFAHERSAVAALKLLLRTFADGLNDDKDLVRLAVDKAMKISHLAPTSEGGRFGFQGLITLLIRCGQRSGEIQSGHRPRVGCTDARGFVLSAVSRYLVPGGLLLQPGRTKLLGGCGHAVDGNSQQERCTAADHSLEPSAGAVLPMRTTRADAF